MFRPDQYELLDFGEGRKLERFGAAVLDRPSEAARRERRCRPELWERARARFVEDEARKGGGAERGRWNPPLGRERWVVEHERMRMELKGTEFGHVGLFPEQAPQWDWIAEQVGRRIARTGEPPRVLNLFGHTGGSTLAAAAAGGAVSHVDSARNVVGWARRNAELSGMADSPIRWIVEDAGTFVRREIKRGRKYDGVILDPPSFGRGPGGGVWKLSRDLLGLLKDIREALAERPAFFLLTCHTEGYGPAELQAYLADAIFGSCGAGVGGSEMTLRTPEGRALAAGTAARWPEE